MKDGIAKLTGSDDEVEVQRIWKIGHDRSVYPAHLLVFPSSPESVLSGLQGHYKLAIVTSRVKEGIEIVYNTRDATQFFELAVAYEAYTHPKPHPEPLRVAMQKLGVDPQETLYRRYLYRYRCCEGGWNVEYPPGAQETCRCNYRRTTTL